MTKNEKESLVSGLNADPVKYWFPIILGLLSILTLAMSGSAKFQKVDSDTGANRERIDRIDKRWDKRLERMESKIDKILTESKR